MSVSLAEKEAEIISRFALIEDRHERLSAITSHKLPLQNLPDSEKNDLLLVPGCVSRVWLRIAIERETLAVHYATESALLKGLVGLFVEIYQGAAASDAARFVPQVLEKLHLAEMLSPTRLRGLSAVVRRFRETAQLHVDRRP